MFGKNKSHQEELTKYREDLQLNFQNESKEIKNEYEQKIKELESKHKLVLMEKDFELRHFRDNEIKKLNNDIILRDKNLAVMETKIAMLDRIVDLNADIIDIKNLVNALINKLPTIDLKSLTIQNK